MSTTAVVLTALLGSGGLGGLLVLLKSLTRAERSSVMVATAERGALVLERLNDRLERRVGELEAELAASEAKRDVLAEQLGEYRRRHPRNPGG